MNVIIITPAKIKSLSGNRTTAARWALLLKQLGHKVTIDVQWNGKPYDVMIALHAWRSADAIKAFKEQLPNHPLIVALTGTDAYRFIHTHKETTIQSIKLADYLVGLHDLISETIPVKYRDKLHVIYQSAKSINIRKPVKRHFRICVAGHLREEKDPLRPAMAVRNIHSKSHIQIFHYGKAHSPEWAELAYKEMQNNNRYQWKGEVSHYKLRQAFQCSHLLVLPSRMEGGANVISEAIMAGLPIVASEIEGSIGLLGKDYPGYYPVEDEKALAKLLLRAETDKAFYQSLASACSTKRVKFTPEQERKSWNELLQKLEQH